LGNKKRQTRNSRQHFHAFLGTVFFGDGSVFICRLEGGKPYGKILMVSILTKQMIGSSPCVYSVYILGAMQKSFS
jgi:hypothetical protein